MPRLYHLLGNNPTEAFPMSPHHITNVIAGSIARGDRITIEPTAAGGNRVVVWVGESKLIRRYHIHPK